MSPQRLSLRLPMRQPLVSLLPLALTCALAAPVAAQQTPFFPGNLVVSVEGCGVYGGGCTVAGGTGTGEANSAPGGYGGNQAGPFTLFQFAPMGTAAVTYVNTLVLCRRPALAPICPSPASTVRRRRAPCSSPATANTSRCSATV